MTTTRDTEQRHAAEEETRRFGAMIDLGRLAELAEGRGQHRSALCYRMALALADAAASGPVIDRTGDLAGTVETLDHIGLDAFRVSYAVEHGTGEG